MIMVYNLNHLRIKRAKLIIDSLKNFEELEFFSPRKKNNHVYHLLSAYYKPSKKMNRDNLIDRLYKNYSIKCAVQYYPLYRYDLFKKFGFAKNNCPNTDLFFNNMISFPFHVWMSEKQVKYLVSSIKKTLISLRKYR